MVLAGGLVVSAACFGVSGRGHIPWLSRQHPLLGRARRLMFLLSAGISLVPSVPGG